MKFIPCFANIFSIDVSVLFGQRTRIAECSFSILDISSSFLAAYSARLAIH